MSRIILGNLDAEADWAAHALGVPRQTLPRSAARAATAAGSLLRAFAQDGDTLALLTALPATRLAAIDGLATPALVAGRSPLRSEQPTLAWAADPRLPQHTVASLPSEAAPLHEVAWQQPTAAVAVAAAVGDRAFALTVAHALDMALPGARIVDSVADLEQAVTGVMDAWVVKARFAAAGRWRYIHRGGALPTARVARLFKRHGSLVVEPWMSRSKDFGASAWVDGAGVVRLWGLHRQKVDRNGGFLGLTTTVRGTGSIGLWPSEQRQLETAVEAVGQALHEHGYVGPFGVDAWRFRQPDGSPAFHPLGEINARMTFGLVTRALIERLRPAHGWSDDATMSLALGRVVPDNGLALLHPDPDQGGGAIWLEVD